MTRATTLSASTRPSGTDSGESWSDRLMWGLLLLFALSMMLSTAVVQTTAVLLFILWVVQRAAAGTVRVRSTVLDLPVLVFLTARIVSIAVSSVADRSFQALYTEVFFYSIFFIVSDVVVGWDHVRLRTFFRAIVLAAGIAAIIGISKVVFFGAVRASSVTSGYYSLGLYLSAVCAMALVLGREPFFFPRREVWAGVCVLLSAGILLTYNRLHWVTLLCAVFVVGVMRERKALLAALILGTVSVLFIPSVQERFLQLVHLTSHLSDRDILWKGALMRAGEHVVFGFGPRSFPDIFPLFGELQDKGIGGWHNDYLQVYMESGIVGLLAFLWLIAAVGYHGVRALKQEGRTQESRNLIGGILLAISIFFIAGGVFDTVVSLLFWTLLAILAVMIGRKVESGRMSAHQAVGNVVA
jgi:O-antigen ligase